MRRSSSLWFALTLAAVPVLSPAASPDASYRVSIATRFGDLAPNDGLIILTAPYNNYPDATEDRRLHLAIQPDPPLAPHTSWSSTGTVTLLLQPEIRNSVPVNPPDVEIEPGAPIGPFTVSALLGPPLNVRVTRPGFSYAKLSLGCARGNPGGVRFDATGVPHEVASPALADIYVTGPAIPSIALWDHCAAAYHDANAESFTLHVPGGGVILEKGRLAFPSVSSADVHANTATSFPLGKLHGTLLWRTRSGRLVKTLAGDYGPTVALIAPTLMADAAGTFADVTFFHAPATTNAPERPAQIEPAAERP
jgi:hypothetical protein